MEQTPIYSIGHGNRSKEEFLELLERYGIWYLADVRSVPYSGFNPQYNREHLASYLHANNIRYVYMGDSLGGRPTDITCINNDGKIDYELLMTKDFYKKGISRLKTAYEKQVPVAIMCSESKPTECHRSRHIGSTLLKEGIVLQHIDENGLLKSQEAVINNELNKGKRATLFGEISIHKNRRSGKSGHAKQ